MRTYYFDIRDGVPVRDRVGVQLPTCAAAIAHSKTLAQRLGHEHPVGDSNLVIAVIDESGAELHREKVYPSAG